MSFSTEDEEMLLDIFKIYAPSREEGKMIDYIESFLLANEIPFTKDKNGNIFSLSNTKKPILSSHMDSVGDSDCGFLNEFVNIFYYRRDRIIKGMGNIGGDDKCGIFLILKKLKEDKTLNFIFSICEESGCVGINQVIPENKIDEFPYALILDRRGFGDIICNQNLYGSKEFEDELARVGKDFKYTPTKGSVSDANAISKYINCANLSVGYHNPHSKKEFVSLNNLYNTYLYMEAILSDFNKKVFKKQEIPIVKTNVADSYGWEYDDSWKNRPIDFYSKNFWCVNCRSYRPNEEKSVITNYPRECICSTCFTKKNKVKSIGD